MGCCYSFCKEDSGPQVKNRNRRSRWGKSLPRSPSYHWHYAARFLSLSLSHERISYYLANSTAYLTALINARGNTSLYGERDSENDGDKVVETHYFCRYSSTCYTCYINLLVLVTLVILIMTFACPQNGEANERTHLLVDPVSNNTNIPRVHRYSSLCLPSANVSGSVQSLYVCSSFLYLSATTTLASMQAPCLRRQTNKVH